jgi:hypothetical protein
VPGIIVSAVGKIRCLKPIIDLRQTCESQQRLTQVGITGFTDHIK